MRRRWKKPAPRFPHRKDKHDPPQMASRAGLHGAFRLGRGCGYGGVAVKYDVTARGHRAVLLLSIVGGAVVVGALFLGVL
jgi:hypothetical protein